MVCEQPVSRQQCPENREQRIESTASSQQTQHRASTEQEPDRQEDTKGAAHLEALPGCHLHLGRSLASLLAQSPQYPLRLSGWASSE